MPLKKVALLWVGEHLESAELGKGETSPTLTSHLSSFGRR
jgi:hypothetical protein